MDSNVSPRFGSIASYLYVGLFITRGRLIDDNSIVKILRV